MMALVYGFRKVKFFSSKEMQPEIRFSVIIPFRNEFENLSHLLKTIEELNYPSQLFEIIFVNDASTDSSEAIVLQAIENSNFSIRLLQNKRVSNSPKKDTISEAIKNSNFEWIVTTDADCELPENWLKTLDAFIQINIPVMVCGPVVYQSNGSFIENFQQLDGLSLQAVTIGSFGFGNPLLSNGANLAYKKDGFIEVNGFSGNDHIASGDDVFLLEKMKKAFPKQVKFLKSEGAIVSTKPQLSWRNVLNQRVRWASKTSKQKNAASLLLGLLVLFVNASVLAIPFFMVFDSKNFIFYLTLPGLKIVADYLFVSPSSKFFGTTISNYKFQIQIFIYAAVVLMVVIRSLSGNYSWKGRNFN
jgi:glycosyltransferase involved in cell wall biosynthesis